MKNNYTEREQMYIDYKLELCKMDGLDGLRGPVEKYLLDVRMTEKYPDLAEWIAIEYDGSEVGFLIITKGELLKRGEDYRIEESYIKPEYRRKGLMSKAVKEYIAAHPGKYSLQMMLNNINSAKFWLPLIGKMIYGNPMLHPGDDGDLETIDILFDTEKKDGKKD